MAAAGQPVYLVIDYFCGVLDNNRDFSGNKMAR
jgi:hypothetical protein